MRNGFRSGCASPPLSCASMRRQRPRLRDVGHDPDYRFTLANERTFLAWIRTALALVAAGLVVAQWLPPFPIDAAREALGVALIVLGTGVAATSYRRWERNERALRTNRPLPASRLPLLLAAGLCIIAAVTLALLLWTST
jgi:putative membrane protein